jgi:hypothetical protein
MIVRLISDSLPVLMYEESSLCKICLISWYLMVVLISNSRPVLVDVDLVSQILLTVREMLAQQPCSFFHFKNLCCRAKTELVCTVGLLLDFTKSIPPRQNQNCQIAEIKKQLCLSVISYYEEK